MCLNTKITTTIIHSVHYSLFDPARNSVCDSVSNPVYDSVNDSMCIPVWNSVYGSVRDSVNSKLTSYEFK
jgi:hypothetical protein